MGIGNNPQILIAVSGILVAIIGIFVKVLLSKDGRSWFKNVYHSIKQIAINLWSRFYNRIFLILGTEALILFVIVRNNYMTWGMGISIFISSLLLLSCLVLSFQIMNREFQTLQHEVKHIKSQVNKLTEMKAVEVNAIQKKMA